MFPTIKIFKTFDSLLVLYSNNWLLIQDATYKNNVAIYLKISNRLLKLLLQNWRVIKICPGLLQLNFTWEESGWTENPAFETFSVAGFQVGNLQKEVVQNWKTMDALALSLNV